MSRWNRPALAMALVAGCSTTHAPDGVRAKQNTTIDLISPATCTTQGSHLLYCAVPSRTLPFTTFDTAVPLRTKLAVTRSGNCSTGYQLGLLLSPDGQPATPFTYIAGGSTVIRRNDGGVIANLSLSDPKPNDTHSAAFATSCNISLDISPNELDVDDKAGAQAIIKKLQDDLTAKQNLAARYQELLLYSKAFAFLKSITDNFLGQLTDDSLQSLRASAEDALPALAQVITDCNSLSPDQRHDLFTLTQALGKLDHPEDWRNADGSTKTLADFLGDDDAKVLATISQLGQSSGGDGGAPVDYDALYKQAEIDLSGAQAKLALAQKQLSAFLTP